MREEPEDGLPVFEAPPCFGCSLDDYCAENGTMCRAYSAYISERDVVSTDFRPVFSRDDGEERCLVMEPKTVPGKRYRAKRDRERRMRERMREEGGN